jgi:hypothetical protein
MTYSTSQNNFPAQALIYCTQDPNPVCSSVCRICMYISTYFIGMTALELASFLNFKFTLTTPKTQTQIYQNALKLCIKLQTNPR